MIVLNWMFLTLVGYHFAMVLFCWSLYVLMHNVLRTMTHIDRKYGQIHFSVSHGMGSGTYSPSFPWMPIFKLKVSHFVTTQIFAWY